MTLSDPATVLPLMIREMGGSHMLAGLVPSVRLFGWLLPQFFVAAPLQRLQRYLPTVRVLEITRAAVYAGLALVLAGYGAGHTEMALPLFFALFVVARLAAGSSAVARAELVARMVPPEQRSNVVSVRSFTGDIGGFGAGLLISVILGAQGLSFPLNYAWLLAISSASFLLAISALSAVVEPAGAPRGTSIDLKRQLARTPALLRADRVFRQYIIARGIGDIAGIADPFYILYATEVLGVPPAMSGLYLAARMVVRMLSNLVWARTCRRHGNLWTFRTARLLGALEPVAVLGFGLLRLLLWRDGLPPYAGILFALPFSLQGLAISANNISRTSYLYEIAPDGDRPTYIGLSNTLLGPLQFLPTLGGLLVTTVGYPAVFLLAAASAVASYLVTAGVHGPASTRPDGGASDVGQCAAATDAP